MTGKTHISLGMITTLLLTKPDTPKDIVICLGVCSIGSVLSDIDVSTSESSNVFNKTLATLGISIMVLFFAECKWGICIHNSINESILRIIIGLIFFLCVCIYGRNKPHRSFMHSFLAITLITMATYIILPEGAIYMAISMLSHVLIDILNKKKVQILYPIDKGISLNLCKADGVVNNLLFRISSILLMGYIIYNIFISIL